jgi:hypothetical protein
MKKIKVFLGGTCAGTTWRDKLIKLLEPNIDYFNPVVDDWTPACQEREIKERQECDFVLYVITPKMKGVYSIAEVVQDSNVRPDKTIFCVLEQDYSKMGYSETLTFDEFQIRSLNMVKQIVHDNGAKVCTDLQHIADYIKLKATGQKINLY